MKFAIRVDDIGWSKLRGQDNEKLPDKGLTLARQFHAAMRGLPFLAGVIPACLDDEGRAWLRSNPPGVTVAMHGYQHLPSRPSCDSEFDDFPLSECKRLIALGKKALGVPTRHFIAPWNAYPEPLIAALLVHGIGIHWTAPPKDGGPPPPVERLEGRTCVPSFLPLYSSTLWNMSATCRAINETLAPFLDAPGMAVITLHITWECSFCDDFRGVKWLVDRIGGLVVAPDEYVRLA